MKDRIRSCLYPLLVFTIVGSLWAVGESKALEDVQQTASYTRPLTHQRLRDCDDAPFDGYLSASPVDP